MFDRLPDIPEDQWLDYQAELFRKSADQIDQGHEFLMRTSPIAEPPMPVISAPPARDDWRLPGALDVAPPAPPRPPDDTPPAPLPTGDQPDSLFPSDEEMFKQAGLGHIFGPNQNELSPPEDSGPKLEPQRFAPEDYSYLDAAPGQRRVSGQQLYEAEQRDIEQADRPDLLKGLQHAGRFIKRQAETLLGGLPQAAGDYSLGREEQLRRSAPEIYGSPEARAEGRVYLPESLQAVLAPLSLDQRREAVESMRAHGTIPPDAEVPLQFDRDPTYVSPEDLNKATRNRSEYARVAAGIPAAHEALRTEKQVPDLSVPETIQYGETMSPQREREDVQTGAGAIQGLASFGLGQAALRSGPRLAQLGLRAAQGLVDPAESAFVAAGKVGRLAREAPSPEASSIVPVDVAAQQPGPLRTKYPTDFLAMADSKNQSLGLAPDDQPLIDLTPDGLEIYVHRWNKPAQAGGNNGRGGEWYSFGRRTEAYRASDTAGVGGSQLIQGRTLFRNPYLVDTGTLVENMGPNFLPQNISQEASSGSYRLANELYYDVHDGKKTWQDFVEPIKDYLTRFGGNPDDAETIARFYGHDTLEARTALIENVITGAAKRLGYDAIISYTPANSYSSGSIAEIADLRENMHPTPTGDFRLRPQYEGVQEVPLPEPLPHVKEAPPGYTPPPSYTGAVTGAPIKAPTGPPPPPVAKAKIDDLATSEVSKVLKGFMTQLGSPHFMASYEYDLYKQARTYSDYLDDYLKTPSSFTPQAAASLVTQSKDFLKSLNPGDLEHLLPQADSIIAAQSSTAAAIKSTPAVPANAEQTAVLHKIGDTLNNALYKTSFPADDSTLVNDIDEYLGHLDGYLSKPHLYKDSTPENWIEVGNALLSKAGEPQVTINDMVPVTTGAGIVMKKPHPGMKTVEIAPTKAAPQAGPLTFHDLLDQDWHKVAEVGDGMTLTNKKYPGIEVDAWANQPGVFYVWSKNGDKAGGSLKNVTDYSEVLDAIRPPKPVGLPTPYGSSLVGGPVSGGQAARAGSNLDRLRAVETEPGVWEVLDGRGDPAEEGIWFKSRADAENAAHHYEEVARQTHGDLRATTRSAATSRLMGTSMTRAAAEGAVGGALGQDENATPEQRLEGAAAGAAGGVLRHVAGSKVGLRVSQGLIWAAKHAPDPDLAHNSNAHLAELERMRTRDLTPPGDGLNPIERLRRNVVRQWFGRTVDVSVQQDQIAAIKRAAGLGNLNDQENARALWKMNTDRATQQDIEDHLEPAIERVWTPEHDDRGKLDALLILRNRLNQAQAVGQRVEQQVGSRPLRTLKGEFDLKAAERRVSAYTRLKAKATDPAKLAEYDKKLSEATRARDRVAKKLAKDKAAQATARATKATAAGQAAEQNRAFPGGMVDADNRKALADLEATVKALPNGAARWSAITRSADRAVAFGHDLLKRKLDAGVISQELYDTLKARYPAYVPTRIIEKMDELAPMVGRGKRLSMSDIDVKRLTPEGTDADQLSALTALGMSAFKTNALVRKNRIINALLKWRDLDPSGWGAVTREVAAGADYDKQQYTMINGFRDGEAVHLLLPKAFEAVVQAPTIPQVNWGPLTALASFFTAVTTRRQPMFALFKNILIDMPGSAIRTTSIYGPKAGVEFMQEWARLVRPGGEAWKGLAEGRLHGDLAEFIRRGGGMHGYFSSKPKDIDDIIKELGYKPFVINKPGDLHTAVKALLGDKQALKDFLLLAGVEHVGERLELAPRVSAMRVAERHGASKLESMVAGRTVSLDFQEGGAAAKTMAQVIPYFNVGFQELAQLPRTARENPKMFLGAVAGLVVAPTLAFEAWNRRDPETERAYDDVPDFVKDRGLVFMLPGVTGTDKEGNPRPNYALIPLGIYAPFASAAREAFMRLGDRGQQRGLLEWVAGNAPSFSPTRNFGGDTLVGLMPPVIGTGVQLAADKDLFRGSPIATKFRDEQATPTIKTIAGLTGQRPSQLQFIADDLSGGLGKLATGFSDIGVNAAQQGPEAELRNRLSPTRPQDFPLLGGFVGQAIKDTPGANLERARTNVLTNSARDILKQSGVAFEPQQVRDTINGVKLTRAELATYQQYTNRYIDEAIHKLASSPSWRRARPAERDKLLQSAVNDAHERAQAAMLRSLSPSDLARRRHAAALTNRTI